MKKRILSVVLVLLFCAGLNITSFAAEEGFLYDNAALLTEEEAAEIQEDLAVISQTYNAQIVIATVGEVEDGDVDAYVENLYDSMGFGYGENHDGVMLLICMNPREYRILSNGFAADAIVMDDIDSIGDAIVSDLSDGEYADAFRTFIGECEFYIDGYINGFPFAFGFHLIIAVVIGLVVGLIVALVLRGQLKSVRMQKQADQYIKNGSMQIRNRKDIFLYRSVIRTEKETDNNGSKSSGSSRNVGGGSF